MAPIPNGLFRWILKRLALTLLHKFYRNLDSILATNYIRSIMLMEKVLELF